MQAPKLATIHYSSSYKKRSATAKKFKRDFNYWLLKNGFLLGSTLPLSWLQCLGRSLGKLAFLLLKRERKIVKDQLKMAFPDIHSAQRDIWTYECFQHFGSLLFEVLATRQICQNLNQYLTVYGEEYLEEGFQRGRGTIILGIHLGNWEAFISYFSQTPYRLKVVATQMYDDRLNQILENLRKSSNTVSLPRNQEGGWRMILDSFKKNECFAVLIDQDTNVPSCFVPFFDHLAKTPTIAARLALKTGALVVSSNIVRQSDGHFVLELERVGAFDKQHDDVESVTTKFNQHIETMIRRTPAQWSWFHRRWKSKPEQIEA